MPTPRTRKQFASDAEIRHRLGDALPAAFDGLVLEAMRAEVAGLDTESAVDVTLALAGETLGYGPIILHRLIRPSVHYSAVNRRLIRGRAIPKAHRRTMSGRLRASGRLQDES
jgi:hypothetical protein